MSLGPVREEDLLGLVDGIYEAGLDPEMWPDTLARLSALAGAVCTEIYVTQGADLVFASHGGLPEYVMEEYLARYHGRTKRSILLPRAPQGTLLTDLDFTTEDQMVRDPFYEEFLRDLDLRHFLGLSVVQSSSMVVPVGIELPLRAGPPDASVYAFAKAVMPHIRRAVLMQTRLAGARVREQRLAACIDALAVGVVLLDARGEVHLANAAARDILAKSGALNVRRRLVATGRAESRKLERLIESALGPAPSLVPAGGVMAINGPGRRLPLSVLVCPVPSERRGWDGICAIVFVSDPEATAETPTDLLRRLYSLTPAEARLTVALVAGERLNDIAERFGVTKGTARGQLKSVFAKTGAHGQADLVRLVLSGSAGMIAR